MRQKFLDTAKALCIILVVVGHFNPSSAPAWWDPFLWGINSVHMPLFMFVSGLLYSLTYRERSYADFITGKLKRIALPYLLTSVAIIAIKLVMQGLVDVKNEVSAKSLLTMFWYPSAAYHLWFLWALMTIFIIVPFFKTRKSRLALGAFSLLLYFIPLEFPTIFCLNLFKEMFVFFMAGMLFQSYGGLELFKPESKGYRCLVAIDVPLFAMFEWMFLSGKLLPASSILASFSGILLVLVISREVASWNMNWLTVIEGCTFFIFLTHSIFTEAGKAALAMVSIRPENHFMLCMLLTSIAGIVCPVIVRELFLRIKFLLKEKVAGREE